MSPNPTLRVLLAALLLCSLALSACRSEAEKVSVAAKNFLAADFVYAAPVRSYLFISDKDKDAMTRDAYVAWHARPPMDEATEIKLGEPTVDGSTARIIAQVGDIEQTVVLRLEDDRWRVHLGLAQIQQIEQRLSAAREARQAGDLDQALQELVQADLVKLDATLGTELSAEVAKLRKEIEDEEKAELIERQFEKAGSANLAKLEELLRDLERVATGDAYADRLEALRNRRGELRREAALSGLVVDDSKVRRFYEGNDIVHELDITISNRSAVPVKGVKLVLDMMQSGESLGSRALQLEWSEGLVPDATSTLTMRVPDSPVEWKSREFESSFESVEVDN